jgi:hypothetical protein
MKIVLATRDDPRRRISFKAHRQDCLSYQKQFAGETPALRDSFAATGRKHRARIGGVGVFEGYEVEAFGGDCGAGAGAVAGCEDFWDVGGG